MNASDLVDMKIYSGPCDGLEGVAVPFGTIEFGLFNPPKGKPDAKQHSYVVSKEWTAFFGAPTAVWKNFPGKPPSERAAA